MRVLMMVLALLVFAAPAMAQAPAMDLPPEEKDDEERGQVQLGGYGELHYNNKEGETAEIDFHRFVLFFGYDWDRIWSFRSELEIEHVLAGEGQPGEVELEQAYIEASVHPAFRVQTGIVLIPLGLINQWHEPPLFNGVERPYFHNVVIPTTWWEAGAKIHGDLGSHVRYQVLATSSLDAEAIDPAKGLRETRQKVAEAKAESMAVSGRLDVSPVTGANIGLSGFYGGSDQRGAFGWPVAIASGDLKLVGFGFELRGEGSLVSFPKAEEMNEELGFALTPEQATQAAEDEGLEEATRDNTRAIPASIMGALGELGFNTLVFFDTGHQAIVFGRYERINLHSAMPDDYEANKAFAHSILTVGLTYKPIPQVALKVDGQWDTTDEEDAEAVKSFNVGMGLMF
ncbi:MAG: hypothetical protein IT350_14220 [Deltaproteobacteria bacterium]|nr:hypothetical protein [Deltaproteobacteria bacterium]